MKTNWVSNLKEVRNSKNLTLDSCSKETNVPVDFLVNLESGNFKKLPPAVKAIMNDLNDKLNQFKSINQLSQLVNNLFI